MYVAAGKMKHRAFPCTSLFFFPAIVYTVTDGTEIAQEKRGL